MPPGASFAIGEDDETIDMPPLPAHRATVRPTVLVDAASNRPPDLEQTLLQIGYVPKLVYELGRVPMLVREGVADAIILGTRRLSLKDRLALQQARGFCPGVPIIVVSTADTSLADMKSALDIGATTFVTWPCSPETLRRLLVEAPHAS
jgi:DNA-binding NtrC family response regulator